MKASRRVHHFGLVLRSTAFIALGICRAFAQHDDSVADNHDHLHHHHFGEFAKVPDQARARPNPLETDPDAKAAGRKLFAQHCAECHGTTAEGGRKAPNLRAEEVQQATPGTLFWILTNGVVRRGMPVWSKLPEPERWQVITFLKSLPPSRPSQAHGMHSYGSSTPGQRSSPTTPEKHGRLD